MLIWYFVCIMCLRLNLRWFGVVFFRLYRFLFLFDMILVL